MKKLREMSLLSLSKRRIRVNLTATHNSMKESYKISGANLFDIADDTVKGNSHKLWLEIFRLDFL